MFLSQMKKGFMLFIGGRCQNKCLFPSPSYTYIMGGGVEKLDSAPDENVPTTLNPEKKILGTPLHLFVQTMAKYAAKWAML